MGYLTNVRSLGTQVLSSAHASILREHRQSTVASGVPPMVVLASLFFRPDFAPLRVHVRSLVPCPS